MAVVPASDSNIRRAAEILRNGGLVAFPTETVYGLGADALSSGACARVFDVKGRPRFDPLIVHIADVGALGSLAAVIDERAWRLARALWPGPITLVLRKTDVVPDIVTAGQPTVAVRIPAHPVARALIEAAELPVAAPSANPFGYISPTCAEHVAAQLDDAIDLIVDGGASEVGVESTIIDLSGEAARLLRTGATDIDRIEALIGPLHPPEASPSPRAPGQLASHYAPRTPLVLLDRPAVGVSRARNLGLLAFGPPHPAVAAQFLAVEVLSDSRDLRQAATRLFGCLHRLDRAGLDSIWAEPVPGVGIGIAILDRLRRAARAQS